MTSPVECNGQIKTSVKGKSMNELFLAAALLTAPTGTPEITPDIERWSAVRDAVHETAVKWEIMDKREERYMLACREDFQADLDILRKRYHELKDAPMLVDCHRLPDRKLSNDLIKFNRQFRTHLEERVVWEADRADLIDEAIKETDRCYRDWDAIRDAQCEFYYCSVRRAALKKYRDSIGEEAYNQGKFPSYVPEWRFVTK